MIYSVTYPDNSGGSRTREFIASDEVEVRRIMRRSGISTKEATIIEVAQKHSNSFQEDFDRHFKEGIAEKARREEQSPSNPKNFHKILTNDERPGGYKSGDLYEYKHIRLDYKGRGITQEIHILDIDGVRVTGWFSGGNVPTLPELLQQLGNAGWKMIGHQINQDLTANGVTFHYYNFMRPKKPGTPDRVFPKAVQDKNLLSTAIENLGA